MSRLRSSNPVLSDSTVRVTPGTVAKNPTAFILYIPFLVSSLNKYE